MNTFVIKDTIVSNSCEAFSANFGSFASTSHVLPLSLNHFSILILNRPGIELTKEGGGQRNVVLSVERGNNLIEIEG